MADGNLRALDAIATFPAAHTAAAVVDATGVLDSRGDLDRLFPLASVTKLLTAYAVLVATEEGSVDLEEALGPPGSTVRHLLAHASGLSFDEPGRVLQPPGRRRIYSNVGYELLAAHLGAAAAMSYGDYLALGVLEPLSMHATSCVGSPAAGAVSCVADLARFVGELLNPGLLHTVTLDAATSVAFPGLVGVVPGFGHQDPCDWGLGFEIKDHKTPHWTGTANPPQSFGHFGQSGTLVLVDPVAAYGVVVLGDLAFGDWARVAWPALLDAIAAELAGRRADRAGPD
jgi:CubicO group peptidase (beta-lactamase class C family)